MTTPCCNLAGGFTVEDTFVSSVLAESDVIQTHVRIRNVEIKMEPERPRNLSLDLSLNTLKL